MVSELKKMFCLSEFGKCPILGICFTSLEKVSVGEYIILYPQYLGDVLGHLPTPVFLTIINHHLLTIIHHH